jgi:hypothetical protein
MDGIKWNEYQWKNYLRGGGQDIVKTIEVALADKKSAMKKLPRIFAALVETFCYDRSLVKHVADQCAMGVDSYISARVEYGAELSEMFNTYDYVAKAIDEPYFDDIAAHELTYALQGEDDGSFGEDDGIKTPHNLLHYITGGLGGRAQNTMVMLTMHMAFVLPSMFVPYIFIYNFRVLTKIAQEFGIDIPATPDAKNINARCSYYHRVCYALQRFRESNSLSIAELWIFLYDYAPKTILANTWIQNPPPRPRNVCIIGTHSEDDVLNLAFSRDGVPAQYPMAWQGHPDAQPGDIVIMYCWGPGGGIHSIWQAVTDEYEDPFAWHNRSIYIVPKYIVPTLAMAEMRKDDLLRAALFVRQNMLGTKGTRVSVAEYNRILELLRGKGFAHDSNIVVEEMHDFDIKYPIKLETDVESHIVEPLLMRLGWNTVESQKQWEVHMGSSASIRPDYTILANKDIGHESAFWVWEVKKSIRSETDLNRAVRQVITYARRLLCDGITVVSQEGLWYAVKRDDYTRLEHVTLSELSDPDVFNKLYAIMGKRKGRRKAG